MKITVDDKRYSVTLEQNALSESIAAMCPMKLTLSRSGEHEYYATLPNKAQTTGAAETSKVKRGGDIESKARRCVLFRCVERILAGVHRRGHRAIQGI